MGDFGVPWACPKCREDGSPTASLVFRGQEVPKCKYHDITFVRSIYFDELGNRIIDKPREAQ